MAITKRHSAKAATGMTATMVLPMPTLVPTKVIASASAKLGKRANRRSAGDPVGGDGVGGWNGDVEFTGAPCESGVASRGGCG